MLCNILKQAPENAYLEIDPEPDRDLLVEVGVRRHQHVRRVEVGVVEDETTLPRQISILGITYLRMPRW